MSGADLASRFSGHGTPSQGGADGDAPLTIGEQPFALVQVTARKGRDGDVAAAIRQQIGLDLPPAGRAASAGQHTALWVQPHGWLLKAPAGLQADFADELKASLAGMAAVVDQSHGRVVLRISGASARAVLAKCCRLDFHPRVFAVGQCASTTVEHVSCTVEQIDETPSYDLIVGATFAAWLLDGLTDAAAAYGWRFVRAIAPS